MISQLLGGLQPSFARYLPHMILHLRVQSCVDVPLCRKILLEKFSWVINFFTIKCEQFVQSGPFYRTWIVGFYADKFFILQRKFHRGWTPGGRISLSWEFFYCFIRIPTLSRTPTAVLFSYACDFQSLDIKSASHTTSAVLWVDGVSFRLVLF